MDINNYAGVFARGIFPVHDNFDIFARAGYGYAKASASVTGSVSGITGNVSASQSDNVDDFAYGIGAQYNIDETHGVRLDYSNIGGDFDIISVSYAVNF